MSRRAILGLKIGGGFCLVILISIAVGFIAMTSMKRGGSISTILSQEYVPEVTIANRMERNAFFTLLAMRDYDYTDDARFLDEARKNLANVKQQLNDALSHSIISSRLFQLKEGAGKAEQSRQAYESLVGETVQITMELEQERKAAEDAGIQYLTMGQAFLASQSDAMQGEIMAGLEGDQLEKRRNRIVLVTEIIDVGNQVVAGTWKAQFKRDPILVKETLPKFD